MDQSTCRGSASQLWSRVSHCFVINRCAAGRRRFAFFSGGLFAASLLLKKMALHAKRILFLDHSDVYVDTNILG